MERKERLPLTLPAHPYRPDAPSLPPQSPDRAAVLEELCWTVEQVARKKEQAAKCGSPGDLLGWAFVLGLEWLFLLWVSRPAPPAPEDRSFLLDSRGAPAWVMVLVYAWCAVLVFFLARNLRRERLREAWSILRELRPLHLAEALPVLALTVAAGWALKARFPWLDRSWLYHLPGGAALRQNIALIPAALPYVGLLFVPLLALNLPLLARDEELSYRKGTHNWRHGVFRSLRFGIAHCWSGVPLYVGLSLAVGGLWLTHHYFRGGVRRSTVRHTAYNLLISGVLYAALWYFHLRR